MADIQNTDAVLIATLGSEPQVVGLAVQLLLAQQELLRRVIVLHTQPTHSPIDRALPLLQASFETNHSWPPLELIEAPTTDVLMPAQIELFSGYLYQTLRQWVLQRVRVHLLLAGGRKSMAMVGMTVAQMLLGPEDRVWYLHSDEGLRTSARATLQPGDDVQLIAIPLPQLSTAPPVLTRPFQAETPAAAHQALAAEQQRRLHYFLDHELTRAEREIVLLLAREVLTTAEIAARLHKSPKTVTNQLNTIYSKLESAFGLQAEVGVKREFLRREVGAWVGDE